jgi:hypothetical protein
MESPGLQKALNGVDQQLTWLQQHPQGKVLWDLGSKLVRGSTDQSGGGQEAPQVTVEELRCRLTSLQVIEAAEMDPCKFLATPAWHALAGELLPLGSSSSWNDRLAFVIAAGSILSARGQRQQPGGSGSSGEVYLQRLLRQLQQLAADPTPGVRGTVAAVASALVARCPSGMQDFPMGLADSSMDSSTSASPSTAVSPSKDPAAAGTAGGGGASSMGRACSAGGLSSLASSGILSMPTTALAVLQELQALLQRDPCVSVAEAAQAQGGGGSAGGIGSDDGGLAAAAAAAAAADAALLVGAAPAGAAAAAAQGAAEAADLL